MVLAPTCRLCGLRHWGACAGSPSAAVLTPQKQEKPEVKKPKAKAKAKPAPAAIPACRGRPLASEAHLSAEHKKPWVKLKMSRRTFYRRKAKGEIA